MDIEELGSGIYLGHINSKRGDVIETCVKYGGCIGVSSRLVGNCGLMILCHIDKNEVGSYGPFAHKGHTFVTNYFDDTRSIDVVVKNLLKLKQSMVSARLFKSMFSVDGE